MPIPVSLQPLARILAADGSTIATFYDENRVNVPLSRVAPIMKRAIIAIEDYRFYVPPTPTEKIIETEDKLTADAAFPKRMGRPDEYARLAVAIIENPMLNGGTIRLDGGQHFAPK